VLALLTAYGDHFDRGDFASFSSLFDHGTWFLTEAQGPGSAPVRRWCEEMVHLYDDVPGTRHLTSNLFLDLDVVAGTGSATSHVTVWQQLPDRPWNVLLVGRFHDHVHRIDDRWSFSHRHLEPEVIGDLDGHLHRRCARSAPDGATRP
jgi:hypothetical protein